MDEIHTGAESQPYGMAPPGYRLPSATQLGPVHLQVADLGRSSAYYQQVIGLVVQRMGGGVAWLGAATDPAPLLVLHERSGAAPVPPHRRLGLFHVAILLPDRPSLGRFLAHLARLGLAPGMSDHLVSEALYLSDPDGLGLEIYCDRPRETWQVLGSQLAMSTDPLDVRSLIKAGGDEPWSGAPAGTRIGHVHLHVGDLAHAEAFYHTTLGLDKIVWSYPGALFLSAGGYHHHLGVNTWARGAEPAHDDEAKLLEWTVELPDERDLDAVATSAAQHDVPAQRDVSGVLLRDPWGTAVRFTRVHSSSPAPSRTE